MRAFAILLIFVGLALSGCAPPSAQPDLAATATLTPIPPDQQARLTAEGRETAYSVCVRTAPSSLGSPVAFCSCMVRMVPVYLTQDEMSRLLETGSDEVQPPGMQIAGPSQKMGGIIAMCMKDPVDS